MHNDPDVTVHFWIGNGPCPRAVKSRAPSEAARTPHRMAVDRPCRGGHGSEQYPPSRPIRWRQAWKPPISSTAASSMPTMAFSMRVISRRAAAAVPSRVDGAWSRFRIGPVSEDPPRPVKRSPGARDPDDLDRHAQLPQCLPELLVPVPPRTERGRGVVAGIGVDEHGAAQSPAPLASRSGK